MKLPRKSPWQEHHTEEDGELWLISYADLMTLLFGFFVILFSMANQDEGRFKSMSEKMAEAFKAPPSEARQAASGDGEGLSKEAREARALQMLVAMLNIGETAEDAVKAIEHVAKDAKDSKAVEALLLKRLAKDKQDIVQTLKRAGKKAADEEVVELMLPGSSLFAGGSAQLSPQAAERIRRLGSELRQAGHLREVEVSGHTDASPPLASAVYGDNFSLSSMRAGAVATALIRGGLAAKLVTVRGLGSLKPLVPELDSGGHALLANMAKNRRVTILLRKEVDAAP